jgi:hypothetical protein
MTEDEARSRFGFFLEALEYGTPPHGGIALGLDRIVMILAGAESLREVIPFPKTARAVALMVDAPTEVSRDQLKQLGISVRRAVRETWIRQLPKNVTLEKVKDGVYRTGGGSEVALTGTSGAYLRSWTLRIRKWSFDVLVLLCRQRSGPFLDFVVPRGALGEDISKWVHPHDNRRLKFRIRRTGAEFFLENANSTVKLPVSIYLREYQPLRSASVDS